MLRDEEGRKRVKIKGNKEKEQKEGRDEMEGGRGLKYRGGWRKERKRDEIKDEEGK